MSAPRQFLITITGEQRQVRPGEWIVLVADPDCISVKQYEGKHHQSLDGWRICTVEEVNKSNDPRAECYYFNGRNCTFDPAGRLCECKPQPNVTQEAE